MYLLELKILLSSSTCLQFTLTSILFRFLLFPRCLRLRRIHFKACERERVREKEGWGIHLGGKEKVQVETGQTEWKRVKSFFIKRWSSQLEYLFQHLFRHNLEPTTAADGHKRVVKVRVVSIFSVSHNQGQTLSPFSCQSKVKHAVVIHYTCVPCPKKVRNVLMAWCKCKSKIWKQLLLLFWGGGGDIYADIQIDINAMTNRGALWQLRQAAQNDTQQMYGAVCRTSLEDRQRERMKRTRWEVQWMEGKRVSNIGKQGV